MAAAVIGALFVACVAIYLTVVGLTCLAAAVPYPTVMPIAIAICLAAAFAWGVAWWIFPLEINLTWKLAS